MNVNSVLFCPFLCLQTSCTVFSQYPCSIFSVSFLFQTVVIVPLPSFLITVCSETVAGYVYQVFAGVEHSRSVFPATYDHRRYRL